MRILLAAVTGAVIVFVWAAVAHMATPLGEAGLSALPNEDQVLDAFRRNIPQSGLYFFPGGAGQADHQEKLRRGPFGILVYTAGGIEPLSPRQLVSELVANVLAAAVAAVLLSIMVAPYVARAFYVALLALFAFLSISASQWIWYGFPTAFVAASLAVEFVGWFLAGLAMAKIVRPRLTPAVV
jgi:hypothetical protein